MRRVLAEWDAKKVERRAYKEQRERAYVAAADAAGERVRARVWVPLVVPSQILAGLSPHDFCHMVLFSDSFVHNNQKWYKKHSDQFMDLHLNFLVNAYQHRNMFVHQARVDSFDAHG